MIAYCYIPGCNFDHWRDEYRSLGYFNVVGNLNNNWWINRHIHQLDREALRVGPIDLSDSIRLNEKSQL